MTREKVAYVEIDLDDFNDEELLNECIQRNLTFLNMDEIYDLLALGNETRVLEIVRKTCQDITGRVLP